MTFDTELKQTFDALTERLQAEVARQVRALMDELPPPALASEPASPTPADADVIVRLVEAIRALDEARSLTGILDALTTAAAHESPRIAVLLRRSGGWHVWRSVGLDGDIDAAAIADHAAVPIVIGGETVGGVHAADGATPSIEILTRHASRCLESMTAFKTARALARQGDRGTEDTNAEDEETAARRYARLLVSEIKLYHEDEVVAGRRDRDLRSRLGGEIARARVLYEQRVPADVRERADYFHDELVRTLADGDASLLEVQA
jgi:hypothetical protein